MLFLVNKVIGSFLRGVVVKSDVKPS